MTQSLEQLIKLLRIALLKKFKDSFIKNFSKFFIASTVATTYLVF